MQNNLSAAITDALNKLAPAEGVERIDILNTLADYHYNKDNKLSAEYALAAKKPAEEFNDSCKT